MAETWQNSLAFAFSPFAGGELMPGSAAKVLVTERQQEVLKDLARSRTAPLHLTQRAPIILRAFEKADNRDIAAEIGLNRNSVGKWRRRWAEAWDRLNVIECTGTGADLRRAIEAVLGDEPRPGCPGKFTPEQITQILALACEPPSSSGRPITHWTGQELADEARKRGIVESISAAQVNRYLSEGQLQPHRSRYWLNSTEREKDPQGFQEKVEAVCDCYREAPRLGAEGHTHTICTDEMTGIQALQRIAATKPMRPDDLERREFEYRRHGTLTLIGNFDVVTGRLVEPTLGPTRTEGDFVAHVARTVATDPEASWIFVVDNLNIHGSEGLARWVAKACGIEQELGKKRESGHPAVAGDAAGVPVGPGPSDPLPVPAEAHLVAEPDRDRLRRDRPKGDPAREFQVGHRSQGEAGGLHRVLQ
jgi:Homeodomain-like domain/DDE superfamily endonuclease